MIDGVSGKGPGAGPALRPIVSNQPARLEGGPSVAHDRPVGRQQQRTGPLVETPARSLVREMAKQPPVDAARVAELRAGIVGGSYRLDPERTAAAMIRSEAPGLSRS